MKEKSDVRAVVPVKTTWKTIFSTTAVKHILAAMLCLTTALFAAGAEAFPGTYPFGIALVSAVSGVSALIPVLAGALLGSARIPTVGGVHALLLTLLAVMRMAASVWLMSDRLPEWMKTHGRRRRMWKKLDALDAPDGGTGTVSPVSVFRHAMFLAGSTDGTMLREDIHVRMVFSACAALFAGAWSVVKGGFSYYDLFGAVVSLLFTPLLTWILYAAADRNMRASPFREAGIYAVCAILTHALQTLFHAGRLTAGGAGILNTPFGFGILFAFGVSVVIAERYGIHRGAIAGVCCGMVLDLRYLPVFVLAAVLSAVLCRYSRTFGVLSAGVAGVAWAVFQAGFEGLTAVLPPVTVGCAVLIPLYRGGLIRLPEHFFGGAVRNMAAEAGLALRAKEDMSRRIAGMSESLTSVSAILSGMSARLSHPGKAEMRGICEEAFGSYCRGCALRGKCHEAKSAKLAPVIEEMGKELARDGVVSAAAVPAALASHCFHIGRILDEINRSAGEKIARMRSNDKLAVTAADLGLAGEMMKTAYDEGEAVVQVDGELSKKLRRRMHNENFQAGSVTAYGGREKRILVRNIDLTATRMGGDDIRRLFEKMAGMRLTQPEFTLDGAVLSMTMHAAHRFSCLAGRASRAAAEYRGEVPVHIHTHAEGEVRNEEELCRERYAPVMEEVSKDAGDGTGMAAGGTVHAGDAAYSEYEMEYEAEGGGEDAGERPQVEVTDEPPGEERGVCGDAIASFEAGGKYYMLISDGMGTGREAALTSGVCAAILERLIGSGAGMETSLRLLNNIIRAGDRECSATVDIAEIDLITGEARFIKSGAAPSFVLRGGSIFRLQSKTVPIGILRALDAEMIKFDIQPGDRVIMVSDGAARSYEEVPWLLDMMTSDEVILRGSPREAAAKIVREAAKRGSVDDITAGVICVAGV